MRRKKRKVGGEDGEVIYLMSGDDISDSEYQTFEDLLEIDDDILDLFPEESSSEKNSPTIFYTLNLTLIVWRYRS